VFTSVALTAAITTRAEHWNEEPKPFIWKATAEDIIDKVRRGRATLHRIKTQTEQRGEMTKRPGTNPSVRSESAAGFFVTFGNRRARTPISKLSGKARNIGRADRTSSRRWV
jgi:hypothetical protein